MAFARYAVYYLPPADARWVRFATRWLGWDCVTGQAVAPPSIAGLPRPWAAITAAPRRYGLHATLKPPFRLAEGTTQAQLQTACAALCARLQPVQIDGLDLAALGRFLALRPIGDDTALNGLAAACLRDLDRFRAPLTPEDRARRAAGLRPDLIRNLDRWGYPYVMEAFRFHITLTGRLDRPGLETVRHVLTRHLAPLLPRPFHVRALALVGEDATGHFHQIARFPLGQ